jgi:phosphatidylglycerophosphate synthase
MLKYANKSALNNPLQYVLYAIAFPIALFFKKSRITPNQLTLLSILFTILAFACLIANDLLWFLVFWSSAYILDYTDGTLARMTKKIGNSALRIDHVCDQLKILLIFLGFGIYYSNPDIWILCFLSSTLFLFYSLINHELSNAKKLLIKHCVNSNSFINNRTNYKLKLKEYISSNIFIYYISQTLFSTLFIINGHTLIIFFVIPINIIYCKYLLFYFIIICTINILLRMSSLSKIKKL